MKSIKKTDANKPWNRKNKISIRSVETTNPSEIIYIFSEGVNTEVAYLQSFPVVSSKVVPVGLGLSRTKLIEESIIRKNSILEGVPENEYEKYSFWCVYDQDIELPSPHISGEDRKKDFDKAYKLANENGFQVAYSNDSFELWILLHYQYSDVAWTRKEYYKKLSEIWDINYEKEGKKKRFCNSLYKLLSEKQQNAIANAIKLFQMKSSLLPSEQNPCTLVFKLVKLLNCHLRK